MRDSLPLDLVQALDLFALERLPDYMFVAVTPPPAWVTHALSSARTGEPLMLANVFPYLDRFLTEAEVFWREGATRTLLSGPFVAQGPSGELLLRACALNLGPRSLLVLERLRGEADMRQLLQKSRENKLQEERLQQQVEEVRSRTSTMSTLLAQLLQTALTNEQRNLAERIGKALSQLQSATAPK